MKRPVLYKYIICFCFLGKLCETNEQIGSSDSVILSKFRLAQAKEELGSHDKKLSSNDLINGSPGKKHKSNDKQREENDSSTACKVWRPLLLVVPLRLGLTEINSTYFNAVKVSGYCYSNTSY